jgi:hypothetical protein
MDILTMLQLKYYLNYASFGKMLSKKASLAAIFIEKSARR